MPPAIEMLVPSTVCGYQIIQAVWQLTSSICFAEDLHWRQDAMVAARRITCSAHSLEDTFNPARMCMGAPAVATAQSGLNATPACPESRRSVRQLGRHQHVNSRCRGEHCSRAGEDRVGGARRGRPGRHSTAHGGGGGGRRRGLIRRARGARLALRRRAAGLPLLHHGLLHARWRVCNRNGSCAACRLAPWQAVQGAVGAGRGRAGPRRQLRGGCRGGGGLVRVRGRHEQAALAAGQPG